MILVSDPSVKLSAAGINVNTGSFSDPRYMQGMSHYIEHMLFINSEKYPEPSGFDNVVSGNSGYTNAYTGFENTKYYFQTPNSKFEEALDMFAQFFIDPLFPQEYLDREVLAISSEFELTFQNDWWKLRYALLQITDLSSPFSIFDVGNLETLKLAPERNGLNIREEIVKH